jgi:hypothetical protein
MSAPCLIHAATLARLQADEVSIAGELQWRWSEAGLVRHVFTVVQAA